MQMPSDNRLAKKVLLIGWDAADWQIISPMIDAGMLPVLNGLVDRGVMGNIATLQPCLSPLLWTSIATGKLADKHGILGFVEPDGTGGLRLSTSTSRKTKALWNILTQNGLRSNVVGWYASHPAEPLSGVCISNLFDQNPPPPNEAWELPEATVHPAKWREPVADLRVHPSEISASDLSFFIPRIAEIDLKVDHRPFKLARSLAHNAAVHSIATVVMENEPWDFMAVYYDFIDDVGHHFMPYHPPRMDHIPPGDFSLYCDVITRAYQFQDQMMGRLIELAGTDATIVLVSDHGFHNDHHRPRTLNVGESPEALAASWHRQFGILCIAGDNIKQDERIHGATLLDVAPTILMLLGIKTGRDMDGQPLTQILETPREVPSIPSWDDEPGEAGLHPPEYRIDPVSAQEMVERLVSLGYLDAAAADSQTGPQVALDEAALNLAIVYMNSMRAERAVPLLEKLVQTHPDNSRYAMTLASAYGYASRVKDARAVLESLERRGYRGTELDILLATALLNMGETDTALSRLQEAQRKSPESAIIDATMARCYVAQRNWSEAGRSYRRLLESEPESPVANDGVAGVLLEMKDFENAAAHAAQALSVAYHFPSAHYHLGLAMEGLGNDHRAIESLKTAVKIAPEFYEAHRHLSAMYHRAGDTLRALEHERASAGLARVSPTDAAGNPTP
jgi:tetratricopeptide (TPR) repeat protein/arylsulfatase A-like enzyme